MKNILITLALLVSFSSFGQTADEYFQSGLNKAKNGDYNGAIADYSMAIKLDPNGHPVYYQNRWKLTLPSSCWGWDTFNFNFDYPKIILEQSTRRGFRERYSSQSFGGNGISIPTFKSALNDYTMYLKLKFKGAIPDDYIQQIAGNSDIIAMHNLFLRSELINHIGEEIIVEKGSYKTDVRKRKINGSFNLIGGISVNTETGNVKFNFQETYFEFKCNGKCEDDPIYNKYLDDIRLMK